MTEKHIVQISIDSPNIPDDNISRVELLEIFLDLRLASLKRK